MTIDTDVTISKCREKYVLVASLEREEEGHKDRAKSVRKQIDNLESEIRRLITDNNQTELPLAPAKWRCANCGETFDENPGETHLTEVPTGVDGEEPNEYDCGPVLPVIGAPAEATQEGSEPPGSLVIE
jgi:uncharacterized protein with PIN domain